MISTTTAFTSSWDWRKLFVSHFMILCLGASFFWWPTQIIWNGIDAWLFRLLNGSLEGHPNWQVFWALANHSMADWLADIFFLGFFIAAIFSLPKEKRLEQTARILFCCIYIACIIYFVNRILFRHHLHIPRPSPTLVFPESIKLSHEITWLKIKDAAKQSFPGDHGTTAILFAASYVSFAPKRWLKVAGWAYGIFLCLPRLFTGAHWLSDVVLGSGSIALFCLSWAFYSPLCAKCTAGICRLLGAPKKLLTSFR